MAPSSQVNRRSSGKGEAGKKPRGRYHHGHLRRALIDASRQIVAEQGAAALSLRGVARRLGVSHAAPLHHFADKRELLAAVAAEGFDELGAAMQREADTAGSEPRARLNAAGVAYMRFAAEHGSLFRIMFGPELLRSGSPELERSSRAAFQVLVDTASEAVARQKGPVDEQQLAVVTTAAWSVVHGLALLWLDGHLREPSGGIANLAERVTAFLSQALERR